MTVIKAKKLGICFSGGGARGGYQIGAMQALDELGIFKDIKAYAGTSIGAANAIVIASRGIKAAEDVWYSLPDENTLSRNEGAERTKTGWVPDIEQGIYSMDVFENIMFQTIDFEELKKQEVYITISQAGPAKGKFTDIFKATYSHYIKKDSQVRYMAAHKLPFDMVKQTVVASCSIPIFFSPVTIDDNKCYDGGMYDNVPVTPLIKAGCDVIIVVHLHRGRGKITKEKKDHPDITFHEIRHTGLKMGKILKFSKEQTERLMRLGYGETKAYFNELTST